MNDDDDDDIDFAAAMAGVKRLHHDRAPTQSSRKPPVESPRRPVSEREAQLFPAYASTPGEQGYFAAGLQQKLRRRIRLGVPPPEARLDLHGLRQREALRQLAGFIDTAIATGQRMVLVIHGQGQRSADTAVLKPLVQGWLAGHPAVLACCPAQPRDGAAGASYVYLRTG